MIIMRIVLVLYVICLISFILGMLSLLEYEMQIAVKGGFRRQRGTKRTAFDN